MGWIPRAPMSSSKHKVATHRCDHPRDEPHPTLVCVEQLIVSYPLQTSITLAFDLVMSGSHRGHNRVLGSTHSSHTGRSSHGESKKHPIVILVLGPRGCGKSDFINRIIGKAECQPRTKLFQQYRAPNSIYGDEVKLIDSPGFGNEATDDRVILEALVRYFAPDPAKPRFEGVNYPDRVTGIIYIHHEGGRLSNQPSQRTIEMLGEIIGQEFLDRVTVLVKFETKIQGNLSNLTPPQSSPVYPLYCNSTKPRTLIYDQTHQLTERIFGHYLELTPRLIRLAVLDNFVQQRGGDWQYDKIPQHLRDFFPQDVGHRGTIDQLQSRVHEQGSKLEKQQTALAEKDQEIIDLRFSRESEKARSEDLKNQLGKKEEEIKALRNTWDMRYDRLGELQALLAQKDEELKIAQFNRAAEQEEFRKQRLREQFSHDVAINRLKNTIEDQKVEVNRLKSDLENSAALKDVNHELELEIMKLRVELQSNEDRLKLEIHKKEEISKLSSERNSEIEEIREQLRVKDEDLAKLKADNERKSQVHISVDGAHVQAKVKRTTELNASVNGLRTDTESKEDEMDRLSAELHRTRAEYASLRNHMQLQENIEQADITTAIGDINRLIEEFGGSLSEDIEKYIEQNCPQKDIQPKDLLGVFGQVGSEQVSRIKQDAYVLLEYAIQATICKQLNVHLFEPFHPSIADDQDRNMFIMQLYDQIKYQEPQSVAGRWRRDTFNSISKSLGVKDQDAPGDERLHRLITEALSVLLGKLVDIQPQEILKEHNKELRRVITKAEELNQLLKGSISFLGDFHPVVFSLGETFHADYMTPTGSKAKKIKHIGTIVITVEMGLIKKSALGRGQKPEEMVLRKYMYLSADMCQWLNQDDLTVATAHKSAGIKTPGGNASRSFDDPWDGPSKIVIGIDIGSTQSGVAFAFLQQVTQWPGQESQNLHGKVPTILWYDSTQKAVSFGAEALTAQAEEDAEDGQWELAKYFKLHLHPPHLTAQHGLDLERECDVLLTTRLTNADPALPFNVPLSQIYSDFLGYLLQHTQSYFEDHIIDGKRIWQQYKPSMEVVLAHPNGWGIREQAFLRLAAVKAGFTNASDAPSRVHFVNEAEASVHFCTLYSDIGSQLKPGTTFAVCDAGGSTVDTTVYSVKTGALFIDQSAEKYLRKVLHEAGLAQEDVDEYATKGTKDFELHSKRAFKDVTTDQSIEIAGTRFNNTAIRARRGRMTLPGSEVKIFFDFCTNQILESVNSQLQGTHTIGGRFWRKSVPPRTIETAFWTDGIRCRWYHHMVFIEQCSKKDSMVLIRDRNSHSSQTSSQRSQETASCSMAHRLLCEGWLVSNCSSRRPYYRVPQWMRFKPGTIMPGFQLACSVNANLSHMRGALQAHTSPKGTRYWSLSFNVCIHFGRTEYRRLTQVFIGYDSHWPSSTHFDHRPCILNIYIAPDNTMDEWGTTEWRCYNNVIHLFTLCPAVGSMTFDNGHRNLHFRSKLWHGQPSLKVTLRNSKNTSNRDSGAIGSHPGKHQTTSTLLHRFLFRYLSNMYADQVQPAGADTSIDEPERPHSPDGHSSPPDRERTHRVPTTGIINSFSGCLDLVARESHRYEPNTSLGLMLITFHLPNALCTEQFRQSPYFTVNERPFRLFDSPGFHTASMNDSAIFKKLIAYLARPREGRYSPKLSGILYLHSEEKAVGDERLKSTMEGLRHLVGDPWVPFITIGVIGKESNSNSTDMITQLQAPTSPFHSLHSSGAKILPLSLELPKIQEVFLGFEPTPPSKPRLFYKVKPNYRFGRLQLDGLDQFVEELTRHRGTPTDTTKKSVHPRNKITYEESEASRHQLQFTLDETETELQSLRSQLEQTQLEYSSLRSELQLNDNTEQSKLVQSLSDLNRAVDDFGRSVAEHVVDNYKTDRFDEEDPTTLNALDFLGLQRQFGHQGGKSSLVASSKGEGLPIEDFIDLALRGFVCQKLCKNVFNPFHPTLTAGVEHDFMASLYEEVRRQGRSSPIVASKWRANSFMALSKGNKLDQSMIESQVESLLAGDIQQLVNNLFGHSGVVTITDGQRSQLRNIVTSAWELNYVLKGEAVTLGDFQPLYVKSGTPFDSKAMVEFEADKKKKPGDVAIYTIRLGLTLSHSKGARQDAKPVVICPATVVTPRIFS
ncbi:AIG1 domain-containing protein [Rhizoctonia solani AG-1 IA]|uniref:AIG1 domain-containing protein n=1 Tax=Thanatephorus cucumeris (strain AG1-IA) TaxID=983506 RepID=L8X142_THACA|nr:AIG1 domain-containing protein [Rhizoctonia solani AG-1 IA]